MAISKEAFIGNYLDESSENLQAIEAGVLKLRKDPENTEVLNSVLRALHTIKGSSRMLKFPGMEQTAHAMESLLRGFKEQRYDFSSELLQVLFIGCDLLMHGADAIRSNSEDSPANTVYIDASERIYANEPFDLDALRESLPQLRRPDPDPDPDPDQDTSQANADDSSQAAPDTPAPAALDSGSGQEVETIRVKLAHIDAVIQRLNQIVIQQYQLKKMKEDLGRIENNLNEQIVHPTRETQDAIKQLSVVKKSFSDQIAVIERNTYELQEQIMQISMLPLQLIFGSIPRMVEEFSLQLGKEIYCEMSGTDVLLDKSILEKLHDPIIHIVRNAIDHGIETPQERQAAGKSEAACLRIVCTSEGGNIHIRITDNGRGIDRERVKQRAVERNILKPEQVDDLGDSDIYSLLFSPGFSTRTTVSDLSGRGIGLDIVKHNIQKVKGKITIHSNPGEGTEFLLSLPLSLATVSGFFVQSSGEKFLIPSNYVHKIVRLPVEEKITVYNKETFKLENSIVPLYSLASLLGMRPRNLSAFLYVVVVESVGEKLGIVVDNVIHHVQLIYKPLPKNLQAQKRMQGIVFDESYSIITILFVPEIMKAFKSIKSIDLLRNRIAEQEKRKKILVVDDSLNTREIEKTILEMEGFDVDLAVDGIDALNQVKQEQYALIVTDLDMPRMDGLTLIENLRRDDTYQSIPIVVVSSYSDKVKYEQTLKAGASAFITKTDFDRSSLADIVHSLV